jgi:hypothetical protein
MREHTAQSPPSTGILQNPIKLARSECLRLNEHNGPGLQKIQTGNRDSDARKFDRNKAVRNARSTPGHDTGYCMSGRLVVRMIDTGIETHIGTGDFFEIPPGHDAYVEGADRVELILFAPPEHQH